jgi:hypothetical protein
MRERAREREREVSGSRRETKKTGGEKERARER